MWVRNKPREEFMSAFFATGVSSEEPSTCAGPCCGLTRRGMLKTLAAASLAAAPAPLYAQSTPAAAPSRAAQTQSRPLSDIHNHFYPPEMKAAMAEERGGRLNPVFQDWTIDKALVEMDKNGVTKAVISLSTAPMQWFRSEPAPLRK